METVLEKHKFSGLNGNQLKLVAIFAMTLDHLTWILWPGYNHIWWIVLLHLIGRLTAPIMWFMVVEGYYHTRNVIKYISRLFLLAFVSHFAYCFCFGNSIIPFKESVLNQTGVIWGLAWAVVALYLFDDEKHLFKLKSWQKNLLLLIICIITFPSDWSCFPVICILHIYGYRGNLKKQVLGIELYILIYAFVWGFYVDWIYGLVQLGIIIVWPFMAVYNGKRGNWKGMKWLFYYYYPAHLFLIGLLRIIR